MILVRISHKKNAISFKYLKIWDIVLVLAYFLKIINQRLKLRMHIHFELLIVLLMSVKKYDCYIKILTILFVSLLLHVNYIDKIVIFVKK